MLAVVQAVCKVVDALYNGGARRSRTSHLAVSQGSNPVSVHTLFVLQ